MVQSMGSQRQDLVTERQQNRIGALKMPCLSISFYQGLSQAALEVPGKIKRHELVLEGPVFVGELKSTGSERCQSKFRTKTISPVEPLIHLKIIGRRQRSV